MLGQLQFRSEYAIMLFFNIFFNITISQNFVNYAKLSLRIFFNITVFKNIASRY